MRRRDWIIAAGATSVAAGALYMSRHGIRSLVRGCGFPPPFPPQATNARVSQATFRSGVLGEDVGMVEIDVAQGAESRRPLFIFALPGRGGYAAAHASGLHLPDLLGAAVRRNGSRPTRMIVVDSADSYWHARRHGEDRMKMLIEEIVIPNVRWHALRREDVAIIGWSMGAYGAFLAAEMHPEIFGSVCGVSVAMWRSAGEQMRAVPDAFDDARDFERNDLRRGIFNLRSTRIRLACGEGDPFFDADEEFAAKMRAAGLRPEIAFSSGCHDDSFWQRSAPADFDFLLSA